MSKRSLTTNTFSNIINLPDIFHTSQLYFIDNIEIDIFFQELKQNEIITIQCENLKIDEIQVL